MEQIKFGIYINALYIESKATYLGFKV